MMSYCLMMPSCYPSRLESKHILEARNETRKNGTSSLLAHQSQRKFV